MPSLRPSAYGWHPDLTKPRHPDGQTRIESIGQTGGRLRTGSGKWVSMSSLVDSHSVPWSMSGGDGKLTGYLSVELRRNQCRISALNPDYDAEDEEEDQNGEDEMDDEDSEATSLECRTVNDRAEGRLGAKYATQQIGDAELACAAIRDGDQNAGHGRVTAMNRSRTTLAAYMRNRIQHHDRGSNTSERRRHIIPGGGVSDLHNQWTTSQL